MFLSLHAPLCMLSIVRLRNAPRSSVDEVTVEMGPPKIRIVLTIEVWCEVHTACQARCDGLLHPEYACSKCLGFPHLGEFYMPVLPQV